MFGINLTLGLKLEEAKSRKCIWQDDLKLLCLSWAPPLPKSSYMHSCQQQ